MQYVMIFHANLNYAYLTPDRYEFVIRKSYEMTFDTMTGMFPDVKFVFEASGYTIEEIAKRCPDVLAKIKRACATGQCEFMGSPHAHPMLPNFPEEDGVWSIRFANETYKKYLGFVPKSFWNPECGWRSYVPDQAAACGYKNMIGDFEAYSRSLGPDGKPVRPEIYAKEKPRKSAFYHFGFAYDLPGTEATLHHPFNKIGGLPENKLRMMLRSDRIAQFGVRYFMGMEGYTLQKYLGLIKKYSAQPKAESEGALIIFADDAEYVGTNGWFRLKYENKPDNTFEHTPESQRKLIDLVRACKKMGSFCTFDEACQKPALDETVHFDDNSAWHGGRASTWAETPMARLLRPWQELVRNKLIKSKLSAEDTRQAWLYLTNSYNSDGQWPPTLPTAPHIIHPFNYSYCFENLLKAELLVGGVDRSQLISDPVVTMKEILTLQQNLILKKARYLRQKGNIAQKKAAVAAETLIRRSRDVTSIKSADKVLQPAEYTVRAEMMIEARRLIGGVEIEVTEDMRAGKGKTKK